VNRAFLASLLAGLGLLPVQTSTFAGLPVLPQSTAQYSPNRILVKFKPGVSGPARALVAQTYGAQAMTALAYQPDITVVVLPPAQAVAEAIRAYSGHPSVAYAQPDYIYHIEAIPNDTDYAQQWAANNTGQTITTGTWTPTAGTAGDDMSLESAWNAQTDCSAVTVAVVDSGINYNATELAGNMWAGNARHGQNFAADAPTGVGSDPMDLNGHGTHVAGIIGAIGNNGAGVAGVCWKASLMAVRVMDASGAGLTSTIVSGIGYAVANGAKIINMSLGGNGYDPTFDNAISSLQTSGVLAVVAAGNSGWNNDSGATPTYPCNFTQSNLICVAALDQNFAHASFSNYGATSVDVGAPGTNILSTYAGAHATITDLAPGVASTGWTATSTTAQTGGGWLPGTTGVLSDPTAGWGTALYNAGTDDRVYKAFSLTGVNAAVLDARVMVNINSGDYLNVNYNSLGGDPFASGGINAFGATGLNLGTTTWYAFGGLDITPCIGTTCTVGFQLTSAAASTRSYGVQLENLTITTLTLNNTGFATLDGTSMATPETTGVAALVWAHNPQYTYTDVANAVKLGGRPVTALSGITATGNAVNGMGSLAYINAPTGISVIVR